LAAHGLRVGPALERTVERPRATAEQRLRVQRDEQERDQQRARTALPKHIWVAPDDSMASSAVGSYMQRLQCAAISFRANSLALLAKAAEAGLGVALLPCYLGESVGLTRIRDPLDEVSTDLWLLSHEDLRKTARVRALLDFLAEALSAKRALIEGKTKGAR
jgi:DNA-binding transcriptional LysR family regulator